MAVPYETYVRVGCTVCEETFVPANWLLPQQQSPERLVWIPVCDMHTSNWYLDTGADFTLLPVFARKYDGSWTLGVSRDIL